MAHLWVLFAAQKQQSFDAVITIGEASALMESSKHIINCDENEIMVLANVIECITEGVEEIPSSGGE